MSDEDKKKFSLIELADERILGKSDDIAKYLRYCLQETLEQNLQEGYDWKTEVEPVIGELYDYIKMTELKHGEALFTISENPMCASNIYVQEFIEERK